MKPKCIVPMHRVEMQTEPILRFWSAPDRVPRQSTHRYTQVTRIQAKPSKPLSCWRGLGEENQNEAFW
jgi:hypothetical protein